MSKSSYQNAFADSQHNGVSAEVGPGSIIGCEVADGGDQVVVEWLESRWWHPKVAMSLGLKMVLYCGRKF